MDIAILLTDQIKADQFLDYQLYFFSELAKRMESDTIDVVILNQASLLLKLQVIKYGQILFSRNEKQRVSFESKAVMDYLDFKKFDEIQNQALSRRLYGQTNPMMPLDKEVLQAKLKQLRDTLPMLQEVRNATREDFLADYHVYALAERYLQLAIEACLHICSTIVASLGLRRPEGYHELLSILAAQQLLPRALAYRLEVLTDLREALLCDPGTLSRDVLYEHIQHRLADLEGFANAIAERIQ